MDVERYTQTVTFDLYDETSITPAELIAATKEVATA